MIGHYLLTLTTEQEDRVLTQRLAYAPNGCRNDDKTRCLIGVCGDVGGPQEQNVIRLIPVGLRFDRMVKRFGVERTNVAIRNRILSNRARRVLQNRPVQLETVTR